MQDGAELGGNDDLVTSSGQCTAEQLLVEVRAVDLRGVDEVDAEIEGPVQDAARFGSRVVGAVAPLLRPELPRAEPDHR